MQERTGGGAAVLAMALLLLLGGGFVAWRLLGGGVAPVAPVAPVEQPAPVDPTASAPAPATGMPGPAAQQPAPADAAAMLEMPDGSSVPNLNGVTTKVRLDWTADRPYSPITGRRPADGRGGWEWYEHADGSLSTTAMVWRSDLGRHDAVALVASPRAGVPVDPRLAQKMYEEGMLGSNPAGGAAR
jgi:hypothetical protein